MLAFGDCTSITTVQIPTSVTIISMQAFYGCKSITSLTIPSRVASIGTYTIIHPLFYFNIFSR